MTAWGEKSTLEIDLSFSQLEQFLLGHANAYAVLLLPAIVLAFVPPQWVFGLAFASLAYQNFGSKRPEHLLRLPDWTPS